ncbi:MAG TPA: hypothetical protein PK725_13340 [Rhodocyclaceae bacterium]|nr:hypothetical protein [Rhodocyclaceae bacterium]
MGAAMAIADETHMLDDGTDAEPEYRLLTPGDLIQAGDEFLQADAVTWLKGAPISVGMRYMRVMLPGRRRVPSN